MNNLKQLSTICLTLLLTLTSLQADGKKREMPTPKADIYIVPSPQALPIRLEYPAQILPYKNINVVARVFGVLQKKQFQEGQKVKKGDMLYKIEDSIYKARVEAANASLKMSKATLDDTKSKWTRVEKLYSSRVITQEKRDTALFAYNKALAFLSLSKARLKQAQIDLDYTVVKAPISGTIGLKKVSVGDYVSATPPTKLVEITQNDRVFVEFSMPLSDFGNIKSKLWSIPSSGKLNITLKSNPRAAKRVGVVDFIDVKADLKTSTLKMRAVVENEDGYLVAGNFTRVIITDIVQQNVITIPQKALLQNPLGTIVFIEKGGHVGVKPVIVGDTTGDKFIVTGGPLKSGDRVIVNNFFRLKPGGKVVVDKTINKQGE